MKTLKHLKRILTGESEEEKEKPVVPEEKPPKPEEEKEKPVVPEEKPPKPEEEKEELKPKKPKKPKRSGSMTLLQKEEPVLRPENIDEEFKQKIVEAGGETLELCFQCGTCTGSCPSGRRTPYRIRQIIRRSLMGLKEEVISSDELWMCTTCYTCQERCPRKIKIVDIVKLARNIAAQEGYMGPAHKAVGSYVLKTGHGVPINDATMELRKRVGIGELPPTTHSFPGALEEVQKIIKTTGFDKLIGYNWQTGELE